jgi:hypothetical protein
VRRFVLIALLLVVVLVAGYGFVATKWAYATGERAGWVQKFSRKGWVCKTWEGELAIVSMPGTTPEKFYFTVWDPAVADRINQAMGQRVSLHYEQKVGLPGSCFGESDYWVDDIRVFPEGLATPAAPGIPAPPHASPPAAPPPAPAAAPAAPPPPPPAPPPSPPAAEAPPPAPAPAPPPAPAPSDTAPAAK